MGWPRFVILAVASQPLRHDDRWTVGGGGGARREHLNEDEIARFLQTVYPGLTTSLPVRQDGYLAAEDAVQEALVRAWERTARGEAIDSLAAWVARVAVNLMRDHWRRVKAEERALTQLARKRPGLLEGLPPSLPGAEDTSLDQQLSERVASLPRRQRDVVALRYFGDLSVQEIAARLGVSEG
ncbi:MAG TPA: sigma-70 family RNA polymerase sigma factor, partial [Chloroflexota bacterium]|nr:sigma-70 family RNA polymerase sigma factor [Chloroflexota bacterium]